MVLTTKQWVKITQNGVEVGGKPLATTARGAALLTEVYRTRVNDYPKYFKMDDLSKLGFLASELLLQAVDGQCADNENLAVILFGRSGSAVTDRKYQATIEQEDDFFPSPSVFVYTLPNIVTGEIALRNKYHGETAFYVVDHRDDALMEQVVTSSLQGTNVHGVICGWVDYESDDNFEAAFALKLAADGLRHCVPKE